MHQPNMISACLHAIIVGICLTTVVVAQLDPVCSVCESRICSYQKGLICKCDKSNRSVEILNPGDREYNQVSLGIAIDDTGSMGGVINSVKATVQAVVTATSTIFDNYVIASFNDPYVYNLLESTNVTAIKNFVNRIVAHDGGDCPEMALTGIRDVANRVTRGSAVFVFTDASAKDLELEADVRALLLAKDIRLNVIAVGNLCSLGSEFVRLTNATNGSIYHTPVQLDVQHVMNYIAKYAKYGVRFIRGMPNTLDDLKVLTTGNCSCTTSLVGNLTCLPFETLDNLTSTTRSTTISIDANGFGNKLTTASLAANTPGNACLRVTVPALRLALFTAGLAVVLQVCAAL